MTVEFPPEATLCKELYKICPFFPDMSVPPGEWDYSEDGTHKVRTHKKRFLCLYNDSPINWDGKCPFAEKLKQRRENNEKDSEMSENE